MDFSHISLQSLQEKKSTIFERKLCAALQVFRNSPYYYAGFPKHNGQRHDKDRHSTDTSFKTHTLLASFSMSQELWVKVPTVGTAPEAGHIILLAVIRGCSKKSSRDDNRCYKDTLLETDK